MEGVHETDAPSPAEAATDGSDPSVEGVAETGRRVVEQRMYRAMVDHAYAMARGPTAQDAWAEAAPKLRVSWGILKEKCGYGERPEPTPRADGGGGSLRVPHQGRGPAEGEGLRSHAHEGPVGR
jgi:hypothetical protein